LILIRFITIELIIQNIERITQKLSIENKNANLAKQITILSIRKQIDLILEIEIAKLEIEIAKLIISKEEISFRLY